MTRIRLSEYLDVPVLNGGRASGGDLTLESTAHATKGTIILGPTIGDNRVVINGTHDSITISAVAFAGRLIIHDEANNIEMLGLHKHNATEPANMFLARSRGTEDSPSVVSSGDLLGAFYFLGYDSVDYETGAAIRGEVDGTPGSGDMPGRLTFFTTPDASAASLERMRITNAGGVWMGNYLRVGALSVPSNVTDGDFTAIRGHFGTDAAFGAGYGFETNAILNYMGGTIATNAGDLSMLQVTPVYTGNALTAAKALFALAIVRPTGNVSFGVIGVQGAATIGGSSSANVPNVWGLYYSVSSEGGSNTTFGSVRTISAEPPSYAGNKPTTQVGINVENQGVAGITTAIGVAVVKPTNATNNYYFRFDTGDTAAAGAYKGKLAILVAGVLQYLHYYD